MDSRDSNDVIGKEEVAVENDIGSVLCQVSKNNRVTIEYLLNLEDKNDCIGEVSVESSITNILADEGEDEMTYSDSHGRAADVVVLLPSYTRHLLPWRCLNRCVYNAPVTLRKQLVTLQRTVR